MTTPRHFSPWRYAAAATAACAVLNTLVRTFIKIGGIPATVLVASLVACGMAWFFQQQHQRAPHLGERLQLTACYAISMGAIYVFLWWLMSLKDEPGMPGLLLFTAHYLIYPVLAWIALSPFHLLKKV